MTEIKKFWSKKNSVVFVWPGEEPLTLKYDGIQIVLPPRDVIARVGLGSIYTHEAAEVKGRKLAGTVVVEDVTVLTAEGGYKTILNIDHLCRYLVRDRDDLFARGFNIVEDPTLIDEALTVGLPLYSESQVRRAREVLSRELQRQKGYKDRGEVPPPSTSEHLISWAVKHLKSLGPQKQAHRMEDLSAVLEGRQLNEPAEPAQQDVPWRAAQDAAESVVEASAVFAEARTLGLSLGNFELQSLLTGNEETIAKVRVKIEARRAEKAVKTAQEAAATA
jgi:hypothetical protein